MKYRGREVDPIALWEGYVEFPPNMDVDNYLPLVGCPNPNHDTLKSHFQINTVDGLVHCFAQCGISGTYEHAIAMIEGCDEREARRIIFGYKTTGSSSKTKRRSTVGAARAITTVSDLSFSSYLPQVGLEYLKGRGISGAEIAKWEIGWDKDEKRIVIPAKDEYGITRFLIKRAVLDSQYPKYLYAPEGASKSSLLFGAGQIDPQVIRSEGIILVEGSLDAIRVDSHGISIGIAATLGTGISQAQSKIVSRLRPRRIFLFFDKDIAGLHGIEICAKRFAGRYPVLVGRYPAGRNDPADCTREEVSRAIKRAIPLEQFLQRVRKLTRV